MSRFGEEVPRTDPPVGPPGERDETSLGGHEAPARPDAAGDPRSDHQRWTEETFFEEPRIRDRMLSDPEIRGRLFASTELRSALLHVPDIQGQLFGHPELVARIFDNDEVVRRLLQHDDVRTELLAATEVRRHLIDDPDVEAMVFEDRDMLTRLFDDPEIRRTAMALPRVRRRLLEDEELRDMVLQSGEIRQAIVEYGVEPPTVAGETVGEPLRTTPTAPATVAGEQTVTEPAELLDRERTHVVPAPAEEEVPPGRRAAAPPAAVQPGVRPGGAALAVGMIATVLGVVPVLFAGAIVLGFIGAMLAVVARRRARRTHRGSGLATSALPFNALAVGLGVVGLLITADVINGFDDTLAEVDEWLQDVDEELEEQLRR